MRLYLVRHAQSANNALDVPSLMNPQRSSDPFLTPKGYEQAEKLGERMGEEMKSDTLKPDHCIKRIVSSPMRRCMLTSTPTSKALGIPIEVRGDVFEHGGCFNGARDQKSVVGETGLTKAQLEEEFPGCKVPEDLVNGWWGIEKGCETVPQAHERIRGVVKWMWSEAEKWREGDGAMCLVVHGMFIDIFLKELLGIPLTTGRQQGLFCSKNCAVHIVELQVNSDINVAGLQAFNTVYHMPEAIQTGGSVDGLDDCYVNEGSA